jgi:hypothetical protein
MGGFNFCLILLGKAYGFISISQSAYLDEKIRNDAMEQHVIVKSIHAELQEQLCRSWAFPTPQLDLKRTMGGIKQYSARC